MHAACVIAPNYLPHARVLARSFARHHPRGRLSVLVIGAGDGPAPEIAGAEVLSPDDVGVDARELHRRAVLFDEQGVISSLRAVLMAHVLAQGADAVLLLDADMLVLAPFDDVWDLARESGVVLSPHALVPLPGAPGAWPEEEFLRSGTFSGGFLGAGRSGRPFLDWLIERAARDALRAPERGLLYTQTWLNLVPALFPHHILRDEGINTQVHALAGRDVTWDGEAATLGSAPVRLYHFAGFDPARPERLCRYYDRDMHLDDRPGLARLCADYARLLRETGWPAAADASWHTTAAGIGVDRALRRAYRGAILAAERGDQPEPPDPFAPRDADAMVAWLRTPPAGAAASRYLLALHAERPDLREAFPAVPGDDEAAYLAWAADKAGAEIPEALATVAAPRVRRGRRGETPRRGAPWRRRPDPSR